MSIFVDTAGLLAVLDADDHFHTAADISWQETLSSGADLMTTNYVLVETFALVQHRLGLEAVKALQEGVVPVMDVAWVTEATHQAAVGTLLAASKRQLSLVDCVSFSVMRQKGIRKAFTFDKHFGEQGFEMIPQMK
jgi:uncharacterized protein